MAPSNPNDVLAAYIGLKNTHVLILGSLVKAGVVEADGLVCALDEIMSHINLVELPRSWLSR